MIRRRQRALPFLVLPLLLAGCSGEHWKMDGLFSYKIEPGYEWTSPGSSTDFTVAWRAGRTHPAHPHIVSADEEGQWSPEPGYRWSSDSDADLAVAWTPGVARAGTPHVHAAAAEGEWEADPGYVLSGMTATWTPGATHPRFAHIYAASREGYWTAEDGYYFPRKGDLQVAMVPQVPESVGPDWGGVAVGGGVALLANSCSQDGEDDGLLAALFHAGCREVRSQALDQAARSFVGN